MSVEREFISVQSLLWKCKGNVRWK